MSVELSYAANVTVREVLEANTDSAEAPKRTVTHDQFNTALSLKAGSTPAVSKVAAFKQALTAGAATVNLASLTGTNGATVNGTGLKVQVLKVKNLGDNPLTIIPKATTGYAMFGAIGTGSLEILAGGEVLLYGNENAPDVGATSKDFSLSGTLIEESEWTLVLG